jgi:hypothetical protein
MRTSEQTNEIDSALANFQSKMGPVKKDKSVTMKGTSRNGNEYNVGYDYAPLEVIQAQARPLLAENGLNVTQHLSFEKVLSGNSERLVETIVTRVGHKSGQYITSTWPLDLTGVTKEQDRGSKITYNKRYAYTAALDIILENEDDDAVGVPAGPQAKPQGQPAQRPQQQPKPNAQALKGDELKNWVMTHGNKNIKGKRLDDCDQKDLWGAIDYFTANGTKEPTGPAAVAVNNARAYLEMMKTVGIKNHDEAPLNEDIPF